MAPRYSACSALATRSTLERPCEGPACFAIKGAGQRHLILPDRHPSGENCMARRADLGLPGQRRGLACHCRLPLVSLGRPRTAQGRPSPTSSEGDSLAQ